MQNFRGKKRPTINLKLFSTLSDSFSNPTPTKSPRNFQDGVVGLGIVAAMTDSAPNQPICFAPSPRSTTPIPIVSSDKAKPGEARRRYERKKLDDFDASFTGPNFPSFSLHLPRELLSITPITFQTIQLQQMTPRSFHCSRTDLGRVKVSEWGTLDDSWDLPGDRPGRGFEWNRVGLVQIQEEDRGNCLCC